MILIGEPGLGKTTALRSEYERLRDHIKGHGAGSELVQWVPLGQTRDLLRLRELIFEAESFKEWRSGDGVLHLFLDSLDEARLKIERVADVLIEGLENADFSRLNLRLTCRSADRHNGLEETLKQWFGEERFAVMELAPLNRKDVEDLAAERNLDPDETVGALIDAELQPLAMVPESLGFLLDAIVSTGEIPANRAELYERGLALLVREPDEDRRNYPQQRQSQLSPGGRLAIASRMAAALLLSGRTTISPDEPGISTDQTTMASLSGGNETDVLLAVPEEVEVDELAIKDVLGTALFTAHGSRGMAFSQAAYAEFLCARWLASGALSESQIESLLYIEVAGRARIVPQLHEVASWLARLSPAFCQELLDRDPKVLLRADPAGLDDTERAQLVDALLAGVRSLEIGRWDRVMRINYSALSHSNLTAQLRDVIFDQNEESFARQVACDVAGACDLKGLSNELTDLALSDSVPIEVRVAAVGALEDIGGDADLRRLVDLAMDPPADDTDDELKGHVLSALWPRHLSAEELFGAMSKPKRLHLYGIYKAFLWRRLTKSLDPGDLGPALAWAAGLPVEAFSTDVLQDLREQILVQTWPELHERNELLDSFVTAITPTLRENVNLLSAETQKEQPEVFTESEPRRLLVERLIPVIASGDLRALDLVTSSPSLVRPGDGEWLVDLLETAVGTEGETVHAELVRGLLMFGGADDEAVYRGRERSCVLRDLTSSYFDPVQLDSDEAQTGRERYAERKRWERDDEEEESTKLDIRGGVTESLERYEDGETVGFWLATRWLEIDPRRKQYEVTVSDPRKLAGWELIDAGLRERYAKCASKYLETADLDSNEWFDRRNLYWPAWAAYRALRLLYETDREKVDSFEKAVWRRWAPVIVGWPRDESTEGEGDFHDWSLARLNEEDPAVAARWFLRRLDQELRKDPLPSVLWRFERIWNSTLEAEILKRAKRSYRSPESRVALLRLLMLRGSSEALTHARRLLVPSALTNGRRRELAVGIAVLLYREQPDGEWGLIKRLMTIDEEFGKEVISALAGRESGLPPKMSSRDAADLYVWVLDRFPAGEDPDIEGAHSVSPREQIGDWRNRLISILSGRGTPEAVDALVWLEKQRPELLYLRRMIWDAKEAVERSEWQPPRPEEVVRLSASHDHLFLRSARDLRRAALDSLERAQQRLKGRQNEAAFLWDSRIRRPKPERLVSQWIANHFTSDLGGEGIFVGRELEVRVNPGGHPGRAVDIQLSAAAADSRPGSVKELIVAIEVKCCWNKDLDTAMDDQLFQRYLDAHNDQGIYVIAHFDSPKWDDSDTVNRQACRRRDAAETETFFENQAEEISARGMSDVSSYMLDCQVPA
ncbi:MAG TPA: hypothetical protein VFP23_01625 [Solirubrobacterales bacterium]|nr:hypothetical protein [Solirubrobacterales bacterium]